MRKFRLVIPKGKVNPFTQEAAPRKTVIEIEVDDLGDDVRRVCHKGWHPSTASKVGPCYWAALYEPYLENLP